MGDCFKPWRRKFGVMMLVIACVLMAAWVRSLRVRDSLNVYTSFAVYECNSKNQSFGFRSYDHGRVIPRQYRWKPEWLSFPIDAIETVQYPTPVRSRWTWKSMGIYVLSEWIWKYSGIYVWRQHDPDLTEFHIGYRTIVIPLALLSALLLLPKPRPSNQKKISQAIQDEEGMTS